MSENIAGGSERSMAFDCPSCGARNPLYGDPEKFKKKVFACEDCGEHVLLENHLEAPP